MAARQASQYSLIKEQFDDQLECGVCFEQYTNPKALPCLHSFCLKCLERIPVEIKDGKYYISCPTCRIVHPLPLGGAKNLPTDFKINRLFDLREKYVSIDLSKIIDNQESTCPKHNVLETVYCETCCQVICRDCTISTEHNKHTFKLISQCYHQHCNQILEKLKQLKNKTEELNTAILFLDAREKEVVEQGKNAKKKINEHAAHQQQYTNNTQQSNVYYLITQQVDTIVQLKIQTLATQRQQAQKLHTQLQTRHNTIEHNLKEWTQQKILAQKHTMMDEMNTAVQHVDPTIFQPIEKADIEVKNRCAIGTVYSKATLETSPFFAKKPSTATLTLQSQDGSPFPLPPSLISSTLSNESAVKRCPIFPAQSEGKYTIVIPPSTRKDKLIVKVGGVDVPDSPFTLPVIPTLETGGEPVKIINGLNKPQGIAVCDNGDIVVAENGAHCITILNRDGKQMRLDKPFLDSPRGVAISIDGHILVTDNHRLQKLTIDGICVKSVGAKASGSGQSKFHFPNGIAVHPTTGLIFIADSSNNRIQVFTNDLTFSHSITPGLFKHFRIPSDIALDNAGHLYVTEYSNHCITKITDKGKFVTRFRSKGSASGQISHPFFLAIYNNLVYVSESNTSMSIFDTTDGKFVHSSSLDKAVACKPRGIAFDPTGNLYITDASDGSVVWSASY